MTDADRQRIDKWLWFARVVKTRSLAQDLAESGHVRLNGRKVDAAAQAVKRGDVLTIGLRGRVLILRVVAFSERRGSYPDARMLYEDLSPVSAGNAPPAGEDDDPADDGQDGPQAERPPVLAPGSPAQAVRGEGRPTKRARRRLDRFTDDERS